MLCEDLRLKEGILAHAKRFQVLGALRPRNHSFSPKYCFCLCMAGQIDLSHSECIA